MSCNSVTEEDDKSDVEELLQFGTICRELRKENDMLRESQANSFCLIRKLESQVKLLSEARAEDKKYILKLERELRNCMQEIDYLQDQIIARNTEVQHLEEHAQILELKLVDMDKLQEKVEIMSVGLMKSNMENGSLVQELERTKLELQSSSLSIEKLEESISSTALESQCEIESMKLELMTLEQNYFEAKKVQEETAQENARLNSLIYELEVRIRDAHAVINHLENENRESREKIDLSELNARVLCQGIDECIEEMQNNGRISECSPQSLLIKAGLSEELGEILGALMMKMISLCEPDPAKETLLEPDSVVQEKLEKMSLDMQAYEQLVMQLKQDLRDEKLKAKEEAEDLAQEMAELRYEMTCLLEEERKRRASIEQASLQRIAELEAQVQKKRTKSPSIVNHLQLT